MKILPKTEYVAFLRFHVVPVTLLNYQHSFNYTVAFHLKCELLLRRCWKEALQGDKEETQTWATADKPMLQSIRFSMRRPAPERAERQKEHGASCKASCLLQLPAARKNQRHCRTYTCI